MSGADDGTVTVVVVDVPDGVLIEVIDDGSAGTPVVKGDLFAADGHGLYLVQQLAAQWGYLRDPAGTTVWFHLMAEPVVGSAGDRGHRREDARADGCRVGAQAGLQQGPGLPVSPSWS